MTDLNDLLGLLVLGATLVGCAAVAGTLAIERWLARGEGRDA